MSEFLASLSQGRTTSGQALGPGEVRIVWPTVEDVRQSIEGYCAGGAIPGPEKNVTRPWLQQYWSKFEVMLSSI
jgi:tyrosyl-DNA phosphodiesterase-1